MYRVFAHLPGEPAIAADLLTPCDRDALVSHYREGTQDADQQAWLSRLFRRREWIACDCRADANAPPLMFVRRIDSAQYVLARMTDRPPHARHCPFASHPALMNARDERPPLPALAALLFRWITAARLNVLYPYEADDVLQAQYLSLREVSKSLMLTPGRRLFDFSRTHPKGLPTLYRRLRHASATERRDGPCFGVYVDVVEQLKGLAFDSAMFGAGPEVSLTWTGATMPKIEQLAGARSDGGPFVQLIEFAVPAEGHTVSVERVFAQPVYSPRELIPVDDALERRTLRVLIDLQRQLLRSRFIMIIRKVLPDAASHERGISFQVQRCGPNGRALSTVDVLCTGGALARDEPIEGADSVGVVYHRIGPTEGPLSLTDQVFKRALYERLLWRPGEEREPAAPRLASYADEPLAG